MIGIFKQTGWSKFLGLKNQKRTYRTYGASPPVQYTRRLCSCGHYVRIRFAHDVAHQSNFCTGTCITRVESFYYSDCLCWRASYYWFNSIKLCPLAMLKRRLIGQFTHCQDTSLAGHELCTAKTFEKCTAYGFDCLWWSNTFSSFENRTMTN